ncbi:GNAT family N-acetyltransferase [Actinomyces sp. MRS3W]|uniref:GNAT family N-acetyltransferase n=1 Tax=Actinomyces sp. MRS3W TaxID=2800796 RepID=UPI0028FD31E5|nr:GNAT family N-acetyltransferase [Actinomyces sp. MRS3W]MDU0348600.1 GNAT family N-acetyltransferase [Actinomyces sp. MRS3W]
MSPESLAGVLIRPARFDDDSRVARLLALRGISVEEALEQAPRMIAALPVLLLASLPVAGADASAPASRPAVEANAAAPAPLPVAEVNEEDSAAPVALSGAFLLPGDLEAGRPERWMVSGLIVDPDARRRGIARALLAAVAEAVQEIAPGEDLFSVVEADNHASVAAHLAAGFIEVDRVDGYAGLSFDGQALLLRLPGSLESQETGPEH